MEHLDPVADFVADELPDGFDGKTPKLWISEAWRQYVVAPDRLRFWAPGESPDDYAGVYFLWSGDGLLYVGLSGSVVSRVAQHLENGAIPFDRAGSFMVAGRQRRSLFLPSIESAYIRGLEPPCNRHRGHRITAKPFDRMEKVIRRLWRHHEAQDR